MQNCDHLKKGNLRRVSPHDLGFLPGVTPARQRESPAEAVTQPGCSEAAEVIALAVMGLKLVWQDS